MATTLESTCVSMCSLDYKERFVAEYEQLAIRYMALKDMVDNWDKGTLNFQPICTRETYNKQLKAMSDYLDILWIRSKVEGIKLVGREFYGRN